MKPRLVPLLLVALLPVLALARHPGPDGPRVILYEHADFKGGAIVLQSGDALENLARIDFNNGRRANDRISSVRIEGGAEVTLYTDARFRGEALRLTGDVRDLGRADGGAGSPRFNDQTSSVRVETARPPPRGQPGRGPVADPERIIVRAYQDILERDPDANGLRHYRSMMIDRGWTERMVRDQLRQSEEFRGPVIDRLLGRVYRDLLGRDPDPHGSQHYRRHILERGWTEADVRADIQRSSEYRNRGRTPAPAAVVVPPDAGTDVQPPH